MYIDIYATVNNVIYSGRMKYFLC